MEVFLVFGGICVLAFLAQCGAISWFAVKREEEREAERRRKNRR